MASEMSTAGIKVYYSVAAAQPALNAITTEIPDITSLPAMDSAPEGLECTPLSSTVWKKYVDGLKDPGNDFAMVANDTAAFRTAWSTLKTAYETDKATKIAWFKIDIPNRDKFVFSGIPGDLGFNGAEVNSVAQLTGHITPNTVVGWVATA